MNTQTEFFKDCESICYECGKRPFIKVHDGVALCFKHYLLDLFERITKTGLHRRAS